MRDAVRSGGGKEGEGWSLGSERWKRLEGGVLSGGGREGEGWSLGPVRPRYGRLGSEGARGRVAFGGEVEGWGIVRWGRGEGARRKGLGRKIGSLDFSEGRDKKEGFDHFVEVIGHVLDPDLDRDLWDLVERGDPAGKDKLHEVADIASEVASVGLLVALANDPFFVHGAADLGFKHLVVGAEDQFHVDRVFSGEDEGSELILNGSGVHATSAEALEGGGREGFGEEFVAVGEVAKDEVGGVVMASVVFDLEDLALRGVFEEFDQAGLLFFFDDDLGTEDIFEGKLEGFTKEATALDLEADPPFGTLELIDHFFFGGDEVLFGDAEEIGALLGEVVGSGLDLFVDEVADAAGGFFGDPADAFDPAGADVLGKAVLLEGVDHAGKGGFAEVAIRVFLVASDQMLATLVVSDRKLDEEVFEFAFGFGVFGLDRLLKESGEEPVEAGATDAADPKAVVADQGFEGGDIAGFHVIVKPAAGDLDEALAVQKVIDSDHGGGGWTPRLEERGTTAEGTKAPPCVCGAMKRRDKGLALRVRCDEEKGRR